ncbi:alpha,alpha-trehalase TreF [Belliella sp. DSM 111904]|uniref:Alpha,alpha-trehalase TreF n=1 Tax=Belliella filtrata TaxID=2923435 RepID=A0ABS9V1N6_9BACT|nr:alpha,alpha-trehalase TreF [Belliella filtrata]MCH7410263.1 alpha,alpha-trehalase TreF [Belliella filtrata]
MKYFRQPEFVYPGLFELVQGSGLYPDSKTFVDAIPKRNPEDILSDFYRAVKSGRLNLKGFLSQNFTVPVDKDLPEETFDDGLSLEERLHQRWDMLTREPDEEVEGSSLIPLPNPYVVPGGRFREVYYWDSYFTLLGLRESGKIDLIESMVENFAYLIRTLGHIPNGNRTYFISRSQPPFFAKMVELLAEAKEDEKVYEKYLTEIWVEYLYWIEGEEEIPLPGKYYNRVVRMDDDTALNRYWDDENEPRAEAYIEDVEVSEKSRRYPEKIFRNIRAACESGWDFSSRWLYEPNELKTIQTIALIPVDLNVLIGETERIIIESMERIGEDSFVVNRMKNFRKNRIEGIDRYCWDEGRGIFLDYHIKFKEKNDRPTLAMLYPLWAKTATQSQGERVLDFVEKNFMKTGGLVTSLIHSGQQWDAPNGWAPLQWIGFQAMINYGRLDLAKSLAERWTKLNEEVFEKTGKMLEKYNVEDLEVEAGGGEYPVQDGFGWTNGVYLAMKAWLKKSE